MKPTLLTLARFGLLLTLLSGGFCPPTHGQSGDPKAAKGALETYVTVVSKIYPPAGGVFGAMVKMLEFTGYFGKAADPVGEMLGKINSRLDEHERQINKLSGDLGELRQTVRGEANWNRFTRLQDSRSALRTISETLAVKPTTTTEKIRLVGDARAVADRFLDLEMWQWSDKSLKDQSWTNNLGKVETVKNGDMTEPDFKAMPTLEYYTTALVVWAATIEYVTGGDVAAIQRQYGNDLQPHIAHLTQRREYSDAAGAAVQRGPAGVSTHPPLTLPEQVRSRITGFYVPNTYPEANGLCYIPQYIRDDMRRVVNSAEPLVVQPVSPLRNQICSVPARYLNRPPDIETAKESEYGVGVMANLAAILVNLRDKGTVRGASLISASPVAEPFTGRHKAMFEEGGFKAQQGNALEHNILYSVSPDGTLTWYRHMMQYPAGKPGIDVKHSFNPPKTVGSGWASGVRAVMPMGLLGIYSLKDDGTLHWYWHTGFAEGASSWAPPREIGKGFSNFTQVVAQDQGILYARHQGDPGIWWGGTSNFDNRKGTPAASMGLRLNPPNINFAAFRLLFGGGNGVLYAIGHDGNLYWLRHHLYRSPLPEPVNRMPGSLEFQRWITQWAGPTLIKTELQNVKQAFSSGEGHLYFVLDDGKLVYQRHPHWDTPTGRPVKGGWLLPRVVIAEGWGDFKFVFARNTTSDAGSGLRAVDMVVH